jgi:hypothetical protein
MNVAHSEEQLVAFLKLASDLNTEHPVVISKFITHAKEIEYDAVAKNGKIVNFAISEHVENAGVHSGDATLLLPAQKLYVETMKRIKKTSAAIAMALNITGPFNIQYLSKSNDIKVIECNLRASRSFPFVSKTFNVDFIALATKAMLGLDVKSKQIDLIELDHVCMKVPMFSFTRLQGADPITRVEMASTGEVACFSTSVHEAFILGSLSAGFKLPKKSILITIGALEFKLEFLESAHILQNLGFDLYATQGTADFYAEHGIKMTVMHKASSFTKPNILESIREKKIDLLINIPRKENTQDLTDGYHIRRTAVDFSIPLIPNIKNAVLMVGAFEKIGLRGGWTKYPEFTIKSWDEYLRGSHLLE